MSTKHKDAAGNTAQTTIAPVTAGEVNAADIEFVDSPGAERMFGLKRSLLYELASLGLIHGCSLRRNGSLKGKRLWSVQSIRAYLRSQLTLEDF